jgi:hypothetical protein
MVWTTLSSSRIQLGSLFRLDITIPTEEGLIFFPPLGVKALAKHLPTAMRTTQTMVSFIFTPGEKFSVCYCIFLHVDCVVIVSVQTIANPSLEPTR